MGGSLLSEWWLHRCGYTLPLPLWEALASGTTDTTVDSILGISHTATNTGKVSLLSIYSVDKCGWLNSHETEYSWSQDNGQKLLNRVANIGGGGTKKGP